MLKIDNRIGAKDLHGIVPGVKTELVRLEYGDASFVGNGPDGPVLVGVERKRILDLVNSIMTGRLSGHQLIGLLRCYDVVYLLVEDIWRANPRNGVLEKLAGRAWEPVELGSKRFMASQVHNYCNSLGSTCGIRLVEKTNKRQSAFWLADTYAWWNRPWKSHKSHLKFVQTPPSIVDIDPPELKVRLIKEFGKVSWTRAHAIDKHYPTFTDFLMTDAKELAKVDGIGKVIAESLMEEIKEIR
jgi:ERCC4-type nuclease